MFRRSERFRYCLLNGRLVHICWRLRVGTTICGLLHGPEHLDHLRDIGIEVRAFSDRLGVADTMAANDTDQIDVGQIG